MVRIERRKDKRRSRRLANSYYLAEGEGGQEKLTTVDFSVGCENCRPAMQVSNPSNKAMTVSVAAIVRKVNRRVSDDTQSAKRNGRTMAKSEIVPPTIS
jgi:hypothetical protein